jgi:hypothetical protein
MCVRHVAEQEARIVRQEALVESFRENWSAQLGDALQLLAEMHDLLELMQGHVARFNESQNQQDEPPGQRG